MIQIDAHHHIWLLARGDYTWMSPDLPIARDYGLADLRPQLGDITATILVQAAETEAETDWHPDTLRPYTDHLLAEFGPDRLMWGSDWPVVDLAGGYTKWREATLSLIPETTHEAILGATAARFYGITKE